MKVLIADDEQPARKKIISFLKGSNKIKDIFEAANGIEAVEMIKNVKPDLVFLDIQMPGMNGFEVIEAIGAGKMPPAVFVTAYDQYAIDAFEVNAIDYLLKPFDKERLEKSLDRAFEEISSKRKNFRSLQSIIDSYGSDKKFIERILVNIGSKYFFVPVNEIIYLSAAEKYVELHTLKGKYLIRETMNNIESLLNPEHFARIHRSFIVNIEQILEMQSWSHGDYIIIMKNSKKLQMSRRFKKRLFVD